MSQHHEDKCDGCNEHHAHEARISYPSGHCVCDCCQVARYQRSGL